MSTVEYTRYTRIIHCRPCCNVYLFQYVLGKLGIEALAYAQKTLRSFIYSFIHCSLIHVGWLRI